jgi:hypothetical protein
MSIGRDARAQLHAEEPLEPEPGMRRRAPWRRCRVLGATASLHSSEHHEIGSGGASALEPSISMT